MKKKKGFNYVYIELPPFFEPNIYVAVELYRYAKK